MAEKEEKNKPLLAGLSDAQAAEGGAPQPGGRIKKK